MMYEHIRPLLRYVPPLSRSSVPQILTMLLHMLRPRKVQYGQCEEGMVTSSNTSKGIVPRGKSS